MQLSEQQRYKLVQYIIDLYKNGMIDGDGKFTKLGTEKQNEFTGAWFIYCVSGDPDIKKYVEENNIAELYNYSSSIWMLFSKERCSWNWLFLLIGNGHITDDAKFEEVLALNRKMFGIEIPKTSLEKAAELLDDSNEFEDI